MVTNSLFIMHELFVTLPRHLQNYKMVGQTQYLDQELLRKIDSEAYVKI